MSRIGRKPIPVPDGVQITVAPEEVRVTGPKGELAERIHRDITVAQDDGVTNGYAKTLELQGVGYRATLKGKDLELALGYSHPVSVPAPDGIEFEVPVPTRIVVRGISKQLVGEVAANIRKKRPPEPYKGKGVRYLGEHVARKVGKRA